MRQKKWKMMILGLVICVLTGCGQVQQEESMRCITFYRSIKGVNSVILSVAKNIEKQLKKQDQIWISTYELPDESYLSLDYKVDMAILLQMDAVILNGTKSDGDQEAYQKLKDAGIPFILVDGDNEESGRYAYIGTDNVQAGCEAAKAAAEQFEKCTVGILSAPVQEGNRTSRSRDQRREGFLKESEEQDNISVVGECVCPNQLLEAIPVMREFLDEYPEMNVLFCLDSASGIAAAKVIEERGIQEEMYVICFDLPVQVEEEIQNGGIDVTLLQDTEKTAEACIQVLKELKEGENLNEGQKISVECRMITKEDLEQPE